MQLHQMIKPKVPHLDKRSRLRASQLVLLLFFTLIQISGIVTTSIGIWIITRLSLDCHLFFQYRTNGNLVLASGILSILLCCAGLVIVLKEQEQTPHKFRPFIFFSGIIVLLQISAAISATVNDNKVNKDFQIDLYNQFAYSNNNLSTECAKSIQTKLKCCGYGNYTEWLGHSKMTTILQSCICDDGDSDCLYIKLNNSSFGIYRSSCLDVVVDEVDSQNLLVRVYCAVISVMEFVLFTFVVCMLYRLSAPAIVETKILEKGMKKIPSSIEMFQTQTYI